MTKYLYWLWPLIISSCGMPQKPSLDRRDYTQIGKVSSEPDLADLAGADNSTMDREEILEMDREAMEVLNQTMKERYRSARGLDLRTDRAQLGPGLESATLRSYPSLIDKLALVFGRAPGDIPLNDPSTFTISRPLQNDSANYGVSAYRLLANAMNTLCRGLVTANAAKLSVAPTSETLPRQCQEWGERFWFRSMTAAELQICVNTGLELTKATANVQERWTQICSVVATAPQFLIVDAPQSASPSAGTPATTGTSAATIVGDANTGRQFFTASCSGCHGGNRPIRARTEVALRAAAANMNHIGREAYFLPPNNTTTATEYHHILAYLKSLGT